MYSTGLLVILCELLPGRLWVCFMKICRNPGGGYLVYLTDGDVPFFRVSFSPNFSRTGYQKKANFLEQVVKTCKKRKFC